MFGQSTRGYGQGDLARHLIVYRAGRLNVLLPPASPQIGTGFWGFLSKRMHQLDALINALSFIDIVILIVSIENRQLEARSVLRCVPWCSAVMSLAAGLCMHRPEGRF